MEERLNPGGTIGLLRRRLENVEGREDILSLFEQLVSERDELAKRQEHLHSLARLVEKTVAEADDLVAQIKKEGEEAAQAKAKDIVTQAEAKAREIVEETRARAESETQKETRAMKAAAEKGLECLLKQQMSKLQAQMNDMAERLYNEMLAQADESKRRMDVLREDLGKSITSLWTAAGLAGEPSAIEAGDCVENHASGESGSKIRQTGEPTVREPVKADQGASEPASNEANLAVVEILPPRDKETIEHIAKYLNGLDEVVTAETKHMADKSVIEVELRQPLDMASRLLELSEVEELREVNEGGHVKYETVLSVRSEIERQREALNAAANHIASRMVGAKS